MFPMMRIPEDFSSKKIMTPGPVPLPEYVKNSMASYECHHRMADFEPIFASILDDLKKVFQTQEHCFVLPSTGTGGLEAALVNALNSQDSLLYIEAGKFGQRWGQLAQAFGLKATPIQVPLGEDVDLIHVEESLKTGAYTALAFQACETSTGALLPVKGLCQLAQKYGVMSLVDGITALGAVHLPMDLWGIDALIGGSQKAFMLPTGLSFVSLSEKAQRRPKDLPRFYFDLIRERQQNELGRTSWSTPTQPVLGLRLVLDEILYQKGFEQHIREIRSRAEHFRSQVHLPLFPKTSSPSLTCLSVPESHKASDLVAKVYKAGFMIVAGQDALKEKVVRVGHMGSMSFEDLSQVAQVINACV